MASSEGVVIFNRFLISALRLAGASEAIALISSSHEGEDKNGDGCDMFFIP